MAQIMDADPEPAQFNHRMTGHIAGKQPRDAVWHDHQSLSHNGGNLARDRLCAALVVVAGLDQLPKLQIELLEPGLP